MKTTKILFITIAAVISEVYTNINAMNMVSYHSVLQEQKERGSISLPKCDSKTEAELRDRMSKVNKAFLESSCATEKKSLLSLIEECREIFWGTNYSKEYACYEEGEDINSTIEIVANLFEGLPEAALKLQSFYEILGSIDKSFWLSTIIFFLHLPRRENE